MSVVLANVEKENSLKYCQKFQSEEEEEEDDDESSEGEKSDEESGDEKKEEKKKKKEKKKSKPEKKNQGGLREKRITPVLQKELLKYLVYNAQNDPALVVRISDIKLNGHLQSALSVGKIILKEMH